MTASANEAHETAGASLGHEGALPLIPGRTRVLIVGLGVVGGSYAEALSAAGFSVGAVDIDPESLAVARTRGWIASGHAAPDPDYLAGFDLIVLALYPQAMLDWLRANQQHLKPGAWITDVTGVKCAVVYPAQEMLRPDLHFIAAHPMAGREKSGIAYASAAKYRGANFIVTPTERNTPEEIAVAKELGRILGFSAITVLTPEKHDEVIGFLSQLTHCIAVSLMTCRDCAHMIDYTGDSFRDLTRIAQINDEMWSELFIANKDELLEQMDLFQQQFATLRNAVATENRDAMRAMMQQSTEQRIAFDRR